MATPAGSTDPDSYLPLPPADLLALLILAEGDSHGYAMVQTIAERTGGKVQMLPGNFYALLRRLVRDGLVEPSSRRSTAAGEDRRRRYYAITPLGRGVAAAETARLKQLVAEVDERRLLASESR